MSKTLLFAIVGAPILVFVGGIIISVLPGANESFSPAASASLGIALLLGIQVGIAVEHIFGD